VRRAILIRRLLLPVFVLLALLGAACPAAAEYAGPIIDAHSHLPNATAIDAYAAAMKRHNVVKVVLLGVGGVQKDDARWIAAAAGKAFAEFILSPEAQGTIKTFGVDKFGQALFVPIAGKKDEDF